MARIRTIGPNSGHSGNYAIDEVTFLCSKCDSTVVGVCGESSLVPPTWRELEGPKRKKKKAEKTSNKENRQDTPTSIQTPNKRYSLVKTSIRNSPTFPPTNPLTPVLDNSRYPNAK